MLCDYGCGKEAAYQLKEGKWCCSKHPSSCTALRKKNSESQKVSMNKPDVKKKTSDASKKSWEDLAKRKNKAAGIKKTWEDPEVRKNRIDGLKRDWSDPIKKKIRIESLKTAHKRPEVKERKSKASKEVGNRPEERERRRQRWLGENNPMWNPSREEVFTPYTEKYFDLVYREEIKREQDYIDPVTGKKLTRRACLHHIDYNKQNDRRENLIWLNNGSHTKANFNREEWKAFLLKINKDIIRSVIQRV